MPSLANGIFLDFENNQFIINVVDDLFSEYEIKALKRNNITLYFIDKGMVSLFLLNIDDALETSDIPFNVNDFDLKDFLISNTNVEVLIRYVDINNNELVKRLLKVDTFNSNLIKEALKNAYANEYDDELFDISLNKIQAKYEPFEMEEMALCKQQF